MEVYIGLNQNELLHLKRSLEDKISIAECNKQKIICSEGVHAYNDLVSMYKRLLNKANTAGPFIIVDNRAKVVHVIVNEHGETIFPYS